MFNDWFKHGVNYALTLCFLFFIIYILGIIYIKWQPIISILFLKWFWPWLIPLNMDLWHSYFNDNRMLNEVWNIFTIRQRVWYAQLSFSWKTSVVERENNDMLISKIELISIYSYYSIILLISLWSYYCTNKKFHNNIAIPTIKSFSVTINRNYTCFTRNNQQRRNFIRIFVL